MKKINVSLVKRLFREQHGQAIVLTASAMVAVLGIGGLALDVGHAYVVRGNLQNYANAAALAAAGEVYSTSSTSNAVTTATLYSAIGKGDENYSSGMGPVNTTITSMCLNILMPGGTTCSASSPANAIRITETASVSTTLLRVLGFKTIAVAATATASMQGVAQPWNVAIVIDSTGSMSDPPPTGSCTTSTEFACALSGVQTLLQNVNACGGDSGCKFRVALFAFPNVSTATVSDDWTCSGTPAHEPYTFPTTNETSYTALDYLNASGSATQPTSTYEVTPVGTSDGDANGFVTDFWSATSSNHLNSSSSIVKETAGGCMKNPGGENTYYAGVIYAAQAALAAEQKLYPGSKNALIVLSDGQSNQTDSSHLATGTANPSADGLSVISNPTSTPYYPSLTDQCQQAIMAAQSAQLAGTTVYAVAFNSEADGCGVSGSGASVVDKTSIADYTGTTTKITVSTLTPCIVMKNMASSPTTTGGITSTYFYADTASASSGCTDTAHTVSTINEIFGAISASFTNPRLLPNGSSGIAISTVLN